MVDEFTLIRNKLYVIDFQFSFVETAHMLHSKYAKAFPDITGKISTFQYFSSLVSHLFNIFPDSNLCTFYSLSSTFYLLSFILSVDPASTCEIPLTKALRSSTLEVLKASLRSFSCGINRSTS